MTAWYREHLYDWDKDKMYWSKWKPLPEGANGFSHKIEVSFEEPTEPMEDGIYVALAEDYNINYELYKKQNGEWTRLIDLVWEEWVHFAEGDDKEGLHRISSAEEY